MFCCIIIIHVICVCVNFSPVFYFLLLIDFIYTLCVIIDFIYTFVCCYSFYLYNGYLGLYFVYTDTFLFFFCVGLNLKLCDSRN